MYSTRLPQVKCFCSYISRDICLRSPSIGNSLKTDKIFCILYFAAIDVLQKSLSGYYKELLPTIVTVEKKLFAPKGKVRHGSVMLDSCLSGLQKRFSGLIRMENEEAMIASSSHPYF